MAFKRSAVRSRLSPPTKRTSERVSFLLVETGLGEDCRSNTRISFAKKSAAARRPGAAGQIRSVTEWRSPGVSHLFSEKEGASFGSRLLFHCASYRRRYADETGNSKYVSGYGSSFRVKCHHSQSMGMKPFRIIQFRSSMRFSYCSSVTPR